MTWRAQVSSRETSCLTYHDIEYDPDLKVRVEQKLLEDGYELIPMSEKRIDEHELSYLGSDGNWCAAYGTNYSLTAIQVIFRRKKRG